MQAGLSIDAGRHAWQATARTGAQAAFRRARRHSRLVRAFRVLLPVLIATVSALYLFASWLNPFGALTGLPSIGRLAISGTKVTMDLPRLAGYTRDGRAYELTAAAALQDLKKPQIIELQEVRGRMDLKDGTTITITAQAGVYDSKTEAITLRPNVNVASSDGTEVRLNEARIDIKKGHVVSDEPVEVLMPMGRIDAQRLEIGDSGALIQFRGGVVMNVRQAEDARSQASRTEAAQ